MSERIKQVVLVRHGQSETNHAGVYQAGDQFEIDPLSERGRWQAEQLAQEFVDVDFRPDIILSSTYLRAVQTAKAISRLTGAVIIEPIIEDDGTIIEKTLDEPSYTSQEPLLREHDAPSELEGRTFDDPVAIAIQHEVASKLLDKTWHYSDEENLFDLWERAGICLDYLASRKERRLAVITHGGLIKMCISQVLHGPRKDWTIHQKIDAHRSFSGGTSWVDNTGVISLQYYEDENRWQWLLSYNRQLGGAFGFLPEDQAPAAGETDVSVDRLQSD